ncbi:MAG: UDP-N-acetylglucosamine 2-epimerase (hydrolyzing) [Elusimicrobia bacterium]|nr:UDP-N-acetylglucosamine 2-epimerase (hydrolyzing) [Elusimicrobiota bacterium]
MGGPRVRKVLLVTGSRGEYGYVRPLLRRMTPASGLRPYVVATNMHLLPEFGSSVKEFERDGLPVHERLLMSLAGYTRESTAKSLGILIASLTDTLARERPDWVLLAGDRGEQFAAAVAASYMNLPIAHIQAGERSGTIDGMARHAIGKLAHLHFAANADAAERLRRLGEEDFRVHQVGAPQLDELAPSVPRAKMRRRYGVDGKTPLLVVLQHAVTEHAHLSGSHMETTLEAVVGLGWPAVVVYPNNDPGSLPIQRAIDAVRAPQLHVERNVPRDLFASLLGAADAIVGNSSAGLLEAPSFELPAVNVGARQDGRVRGANVLDCPHDKKAIQAAARTAVSREFRASLKGKPNPYGDGASSRRILALLRDTPIDERLLTKRLTY